MIKLVIFDLDDTLYNEKDFVFGGFFEVCKYLSEKYSISFDKIFETVKKILYEYGRGKVFDILCQSYNIEEDIDTLVSIYRNASPKLILYKDSELVLNALKDKYKLGLITDGMASVQWNKIKLLGIENYFDKIIVTDDYGRAFYKPSESSFLHMLKSFKLNSKEAVYVGDNPNKDFIGARKAGLYTVRIIREVGEHKDVRLSSEYEADFLISNMEELLAFLKGVL